jgi:hypothetical protein
MKKQYIIAWGLLIAALVPGAYWLLHHAHAPAGDSHHAVPAITQFMDIIDARDLTSTNSTIAMSPGSQNTNPITTGDCSYPVGISTNWSSRGRSH